MIRLDNLFGIGGIVWEVGRRATCGVALSVDLQLSSGWSGSLWNVASAHTALEEWMVHPPPLANFIP